MNNFEKSGLQGEHIGDFDVDTKREGSQELVDQEKARQEKDSQNFDTLVSELEKTGGREDFVTYVKGLSTEQKQKIDSALNMEGKGIIDLKWVEAEQQSEVIRLLNEIDQAPDSTSAKNGGKQIADIIG